MVGVYIWNTIVARNVNHLADWQWKESKWAAIIWSQSWLMMQLGWIRVGQDFVDRISVLSFSLLRYDSSHLQLWIISSNEVRLLMGEKGEGEGESNNLLSKSLSYVSIYCLYTVSIWTIIKSRLVSAVYCEDETWQRTPSQRRMFLVK